VIASVTFSKIECHANSRSAHLVSQVILLLRRQLLDHAVNLSQNLQRQLIAIQILKPALLTLTHSARLPASIHQFTPVRAAASRLALHPEGSPAPAAPRGPGKGGLEGAQPGRANLPIYRAFLGFRCPNRSPPSTIMTSPVI
jgi:hypothetical protein